MSCSREETEWVIRPRARLASPSRKPMPVYAGEGSKGLRTRIGDSGRYGAAVGRAVSVGESQVRGRRARDEELAIVDGAVVRSAESHEVFERVIDFFRAKHEVVHVYEDRVPAAGDATSPTVPAKGRAADFGGNGLRCAAP